MKKRVEFQLERESVQDARLLDIVTYLKKKHRFVPTLREAIRLIMDLRAGSTAVLFEMFPWIKEQLELGEGVTIEKPPEPPPSSDIKSLEEKVDQLTQVVLQQNIGKVMSPKVEESSVGLKKLPSKQLEMPNFDNDDDIKIATQRDTKTDSSLKFMEALHSLQ